MILEELASDAVLERAYEWLCRRRRHFPDNAEVWAFRHRWRAEKARLQTELVAGAYRCEPLYRSTLQDGSEIDVWRARDQLVWKALALVLPKYLPVSPLCAHVKGHGGAKRCVREVAQQLAAHAFICRTDVKDYYASIDQKLALDELVAALPDRRVAPLRYQYLYRIAERGGLFWEVTRGIPLGCPLSPLVAAFHLYRLDRRMAALGVFYRRYMDDVIVLAPSRWKLRRAVRILNGELSARGLEKHPDKTFIGRIDKGFDYLGYRFGRAGLSLAAPTVARFRDRAARLYEQERSGGPAALGRYVAHFAGWARGGLGGLALDLAWPSAINAATPPRTSARVEGSGIGCGVELAKSSVPQTTPGWQPPVPEKNIAPDKVMGGHSVVAPAMHWADG
jgi:RNA-directed DNA polymerase